MSIQNIICCAIGYMLADLITSIFELLIMKYIKRRVKK